MNENQLKNEVKEAYTRAIQSTNKGCGCGCSDGGQTGGNLIQFADYAQDQLQKLPGDAVENAFGCGNPLGFQGVKEGDTVVDIGSGAGIDCFIAAEKVGSSGRVIGVDMTEAMIERARKNAAEAGIKNVEFKLGDADDMPVEDHSVDWVISNCVINLTPDKDKVFAEIMRVLKPGGRVSISDIVISESLPPHLEQNVRAYTGCIAGALVEGDYLQKMEAAGLRDVKVKDRIVYDRGQLQGLVESSFGTATSAVQATLDSIAGKIWSARIIAVKP